MEPSEKVAIGEALWPEEKKAAKERKKAGLKKGTESPVGSNYPNGDKGRTRERVAKAVGWSKNTYGRAKDVVGVSECESLLCCPPCTLPACSQRVYQVKGESMVKTRYQYGHSWPTPIPGAEQWGVRAHVPCYMEIIP